ncbi:S41 family peptidase [Mesoaciditoga sp.]
MKKYQKTLVMVILLASLVTVSWATQGVLNGGTNSVSQVMQLIQNYYYNATSVNYQKLEDSAIKAIVKALGSRFTYYFSPDEVKEFDIQTSSKYGGIGTEVTYNSTRDAVEVISPMYGSPAEKAGVKSGDLIISIDGSSVKAMGYISAVNALRGKPGSKVKVEIYRPSEKATLDIVITRALIKLKTVKYTTLQASGTKIGYVRITNFSETTGTEFEKALNKLYDEKIDGLIIDLRDDPGGLFSQALEVASDFLPKGDLIVTMRNRYGVERPYRSYGNLFKRLPIVILVNHGSASSSEIVSAALRDNGYAVLVGERTYGKAAVQTEFRLSNGGLLLLVTNHYFTPNGQDINLKGITPDYVVKESSSTPTKSESYKALIESVVSSTQSTATVNPKKDAQLRKALEVIIPEIKSHIFFPRDLKH